MKSCLFFFTILFNHFFLSAIVNPVIFQEYGIRGIIDKEFDVSDNYDLACAIVTYFHQQDPEIHSIILGADGRIHSPAIKKEIIQALQDRGFDIIDIGTCTTPVLYFALQQSKEHPAGIMITASHNPGEYNGLKMCLGHDLISSKEIQEVRRIYEERSFLPLSTEKGKVTAVAMIEDYVDYLGSLFPHLIGSDIHSIIDCGNGAAGAVLPALLEKMEWKKMQLLFAEVDGTYPNHIADPVVEKYMEDLKKELANSEATFGLGLDGDGDRMAAMTKTGRLIKGDQLLGLYSKKVLEQYPGSAIVFDISSSKSIFDVIKQRGGIPCVAATGVANVKKLMVETGAQLGGEMSCHTIFKDRYLGYDDGIYSLMRFVELIHESNETLDGLLAEFPVVFSTPTFRIPCERATCFKIVEELKELFFQQEGVELITVDGLRVNFPYGWAIVRASNTEPVISIRFEGNTAEDLLRIKKYFYSTISQYIDCEIFFKG